MTHKIYGVDPSKEVTPMLVRDAIIKCFTAAHKEVLDQMDEYQKWGSKEEREKFRGMEVDLLIKHAFTAAGIDFESPTKEGILKVLDSLAEFATQFRNPEIVKKHYGEIMQLVNQMA